MTSARVWWLSLLATTIALGGAIALVASQATPAPAWLVRSLQTSADQAESRPDVLDAAILPGSLMKVVSLVAALESHTIEPDTARMCRRVVTVDGQRYTCSHPDLKRPLTPAEALAHSCNDFFVSLAPRLPRAMLNDVRARAGLGAVGPGANYAAALVGLDGPRVTPRSLLDLFIRLAVADRDRPVKVSDSTRRVLLDGLRGAALYGSAGELGAQKISALAKTGTAPMPGGGVLGLVVALTPADKPTRAVVVVTPGAAGRDASAVAADLLTGRGRGQTPTRDSQHAAQTIELRVGILGGDGKARVEQMPLEEYVARVLAGEGQPRARDAAQQALAVAIRTFALANRNRHRREGFDLCDTTHCQVLRSATPGTRRATEATAGRVLIHQSQPATIFYSAWCGGRSELPSQVWPGASDYAFEPAQVDDACRDEPGWTAEIDVREIERALRLAGLTGGRLRSLRVVARSRSRRVSRLSAEGFSPDELTGDDFRLAIGRVVGWQHLKSTMFEMRRISNGYVFTGRGFGHGVGMCVIGAGARAARGDSADAILRFYYPGLEVQQFTETALLTSKAAARPAPDARAADVLIALPGGEEGERNRVVQMVRRTRDEIAAKTGARAPAAITITVHPSVESFGRATGQPWWVSGATDQSSIDLLPLMVLQQRGQFERTIRHEVAHVMLDAALADKPMWVREGAALYFSSPVAPPVAGERPSRMRCPGDDEFLRPLSAGAHRDAYARAESCFRRQVMDGKPWHQVK